MMQPAECDACRRKFTWLKKRRTCALCRSCCCSECMQRARLFSVGRHCLRCVRLAGGAPYERAVLQQMSVRDLKHIMKISRLSTAACCEKSELIDKILQLEAPSAAHLPTAPPPQPSEPAPDRPQPAAFPRAAAVYESIRVRPMPDARDAAPPDEQPDDDADDGPILTELSHAEAAVLVDSTAATSRFVHVTAKGFAYAPPSPATAGDGTQSPSILRWSRQPASDDDSDDDVGEFIVVDDLRSSSRSRAAARSGAGPAAAASGGDPAPMQLDDSMTGRRSDDGADDSVIVIDEGVPRAPRDTDAAEAMGTSGEEELLSESSVTEEVSVIVDADDDLPEVIDVVSDVADESVIVVDDEAETEAAAGMATGSTALPPVEEVESPPSARVAPDFDIGSVTDVADIPSEQLIGALSVRQCRQLLQRRRTQHRDAIEKHELLDRVRRLWRDTHRNLADAPSAPDRELCKICWDALVDCVMLECGHMATCTDCGKLMTECPICRRYVVRVVHVFRC